MIFEQLQSVVLAEAASRQGEIVLRAIDILSQPQTPPTNPYQFTLDHIEHGIVTLSAPVILYNGKRWDDLRVSHGLFTLTRFSTGETLRLPSIEGIEFQMDRL